LGSGVRNGPQQEKASAKVLGGLMRAFDHYENKNETAWRA
jgi:hypothetical protein